LQIKWEKREVMKYESRAFDNTIIIFLDTSIYSSDSISKCLYWYSDKFDITIDIIGKCYEIKLKPSTSVLVHDESIEWYFHKLHRDFIDFNLRDIVTKETKNIRELLIAKAFSNLEDGEASSNGNVAHLKKDL
jgi:His-Xaa-Ser system protein HxsD